MTIEHFVVTYLLEINFCSEGVLILSCGVLQLGFLIDFISVPVTAGKIKQVVIVSLSQFEKLHWIMQKSHSLLCSGFTSAAAITIASSQIKNLLGLSILTKSESNLGKIKQTWGYNFLSLCWIGTLSWRTRSWYKA